ncbi:zf-HC2 domain-containing protein [Kribbella sp. NBC_01245]|uniref:anti-sigma factor family protein n=1 Tax=Kribbella sp. NBC_01245 TaxID=2903578 RepID=UPI002E2CD0AF|nr:zf-HC2 domain-containing protein [Kribbella sp. NBC_01245]
MSTHELDHTLLGAYVLDALDPAETRQVDEHLATCADCRAEVAELAEMKEFLGEVPPEAFLDGPPEGGDLLLQRTLRQVRDESKPTAKPARWMAAAAVAVIAGAALAGGVLIGRQTVDPVATPPVATETPVPGTRTGNGSGNGATLAASVKPRAGWVWVDVDIKGMKAGTACELRVTDAAGKSYVAGSWVISPKAAAEGGKFSGGALVPIGQVKSVEIVTLDGKTVVSAQV